MPRYRIPCLGDTWFEISADTEKHASELFWALSIADLAQQCELNVGEPELIRESAAECAKADENWNVYKMERMR